ncbi:MAG: Stp1/IreP family PP2C-type Ser/Thr phosphatase [Actinomycetota bacterium]
MRAVAAAATDIGRVREGNEDSYLVDDGLYAVADGMGGHRGGEVASSLALKTLQTLFHQGTGDLDDQVQEANRAVFEKSIHDRRVAGMGTTLTAALSQGEHVRLAHVGDSRAYLLRHGELHQLTEDHTLVRQMVAEGEISEEEAEAHPRRSVLTRALGVDMWVHVDDLVIDVEGDDRLLLCTDGLTAMTSAQRIRQILGEHPDPQAAADALVAAANEAGGVDNTTVVIVDFTEDATNGSPDDGMTAQAVEPSAPLPSPAEPQPRPASRPPADGPSLRRAGILVGAVLGITAIGLVGLRIYVDRQWYVGVADGHVAIYRGIPTAVAGFQLHRVVLETRISAETAEALTLYRDLEQGITARDRQDAEAIVQQIRDDVAQLEDGPSP